MNPDLRAFLELCALVASWWLLWKCGRLHMKAEMQQQIAAEYERGYNDAVMDDARAAEEEAKWLPLDTDILQRIRDRAAIERLINECR